MWLYRELKNAAGLLKSSGLRSAAMTEAERFIQELYPVLPPVLYKSMLMWLYLGYWPNIRKPRSFNEKIAHRQLFAPHPLASLVSDKWRVRQYVAERGFAAILNEVYFVTDDPMAIPFDCLPDRFVIKANHGCAWNLLITDKRTLDRQQVVRKCWEWMGQKYGEFSRNYEMHYDDIPPLLLIERFIEDGQHFVPIDYKFNCFHGKAIFVEAFVGRYENTVVTIYDREWKDTRISTDPYPYGESIPRPPRLAEMIRIADRLSEGFDYCRVDLYAPDPERILFGEITVNPAGGLTRFTPREWDFRLGALW